MITVLEYKSFDMGYMAVRLGKQQTQNRPTCGREHNSRPQLMRAYTSRAAVDAPQLDTRSGNESEHIRMAALLVAAPTLFRVGGSQMKLMSRPGWRTRNDAGGRGRVTGGLACSNATVRAVGLDRQWREVEERRRTFRETQRDAWENG